MNSLIMLKLWQPSSLPQKPKMRPLVRKIQQMKPKNRLYKPKNDFYANKKRPWLLSVTKFEPNVGKKMRLGKLCEANGRSNKPLENNSLKPDLVQLGAAKRLKMSSGVNSVTNVVSNSNNAIMQMKSGDKNASTFGLVYPTWA